MSLTIVGMLASLSCGVAIASSFALHPVALRQLYEGGDFSELACKAVEGGHAARQCRFLLHRGTSEKAFTFSPDALGYDDEIERYVVFPGTGTMDFDLTFEVSCLPSDLAQVAGATEENATCRLHLAPAGSALRGTAVEMLASPAGSPSNPIRRVRTL